MPDIASDTSTTANLTIGGPTQSSTIESGESGDWWRIPVTWNLGTVELRVTRASQADAQNTNIELKGPNGEDFHGNNYKGQNFDGYYRVLNLDTKSHSIFFSPRNATESIYLWVYGAVGDYSVTAVSSTPNMLDDYAGDRSTSGLLAVGGTVSGNLETSSDEDWFAVNLINGFPYDFRISPLSGNARIKGIYNADGTLASLDGGGGTAGAYNWVTGASPYVTGTYYVAVSNANQGGGGAYELSYSTVEDFAADPSTTGTVAVGSTTRSSIETPGDTDWIAVTLAAGQEYVIDLEGSSGGDGTLSDPFLDGIYDSEGNPIYDTTDDDSGVGYDSRLLFTAPASGKYFISAGTYSDTDTGTYQVSVVAAGGAGDLPSTTSTTGAVTVGGSTSGSIDFSGDTDWHLVQLVSGRTYTLDLRGAATGSGTLTDPYLRGVYDSTGALVGGTTADDGGTGFDSLLTFTAAETGRYYVSAGAYSLSDSGTYTLSVTDSGFPLTAYGATSVESLRGSGTIVGGVSTDTLTYSQERSTVTVRRLGSDVVVTSATGGTTDTFRDVERLNFTDTSLAFDTEAINSAGGIYRLYQAAFDRTPDLGGIGYWINQSDSGVSAVTIAEGFTQSPEFSQVYNVNMTDAYGGGASVNSLVTGFYQHVLHRAPEQVGLDYWSWRIASRQDTVASVLSQISDSGENRTQVASTIQNGVEYTPIAQSPGRIGGATWALTDIESFSAAGLDSADSGAASEYFRLLSTSSSALSLTSSDPRSGGKVDPSRSKQITLIFNKPVKAGSGYIYLTRDQGVTEIDRISVTDSARVSFNGKEMTIVTPSSSGNVAFEVSLSNGVVTDTNGNAFSGIRPGELWFMVGPYPPKPILCMPYRATSTVLIGQGYSGSFSHYVFRERFSVDIVTTGDALAFDNGTVIFAGNDKAHSSYLGNRVTVRYVGNNGTYYATYAHLSSIDKIITDAFASGQTEVPVKTGDTLGVLGGTNNKSKPFGVHLHLQLGSSLYYNVASAANDEAPPIFFPSQTTSNDNVPSDIQQGLGLRMNDFFGTSTNIGWTPDRLTGTSANERIWALDGNDELNGGSGDDELYGGRGNDKINGGNHHDTIVGGLGADTLTGGIDTSDAFKYFLPSEGNDTITDFLTKKDKIQVVSPNFNLPVGTLATLYTSTPEGSGSVFIYNKAAGILSYDQDSKGRIAPVVIANLGKNTTLVASDIQIVSA